MTKFVPVMVLVAALAAGCGDNLRADLVPDAGPPDAGLPVLPDAAMVEEDAGIALACTLEELQPIISCVTTNCLNFDGGVPPVNGDGGIDTTGILTCITVRCGILVFGLSPTCRSCVVTGLTGLASGDLSGAVAACVSQP